MESKHDLFTKVGDRRDIVDFVKEVEKYPCLYDKTLPEYANKVHNRRAWHAIASKSNTTVPECRDKWRKIRISFMRSLKQQQSDKPPMRPYYLTEELYFLIPFLKFESTPKNCRDKDVSVCEAKKTQSKGDPMETEVINVKERYSFDTDSSHSSENEINENVKEINRLALNENTKRNIVMKKTKHGEQNVRQSYLDDIEVNPRKMFLLSMLPDIESLTEQEMRIFRREVITVVDKIISRRIISN